jgi:hypothetical protein
LPLICIARLEAQADMNPKKGHTLFGSITSDIPERATILK